MYTPRQIADFWKKVGPPNANGCREWTGAKSHRGYGVKLNATGHGGEKVMTNAHRMAWVIANGPVPEGMQVCHRCDNRPCCEASHLFLGTPKENTRDMMEKGRNFPPPLAMLRFTAEQVAEIHALYKAKNTMRAIGRMFSCEHSTIRKVILGVGRYAPEKINAEETNKAQGRETDAVHQGQAQGEG